MSKLNAGLVALAQERGIPIDDDTTNAQLISLLGPTPPSERQIEYLTSLVGHAVPVQTFGQARHAINEFEELRNTQVLVRNDWTEGDVLEWREEHWRIIRIYDDHLNHKIRVELVDLEPRDGGGTRAVTRKRVSAQTHNPCTLDLEDARKMDMVVWPAAPLEPTVDDASAQKAPAPNSARE